MKYCKKCVTLSTRPRITFNKEGVCNACQWAEYKKNIINWKKRWKEGKDSTFQAYIMKEICDMNPLIVCINDPFTHTKAGKHNLRNMSETFECDIISYNLNPSTTRKMVKLAFEEFGSPTWPIDMQIYSIPLKIAHSLNIPLIVYGENIAYEYGGPSAEETFSAKNQIKNDVVKPIDWKWWYKKGIKKEEVDMIKYPDEKIIDKIEPIYLSYFYPWDGRKNYEIAKRYGFRDLKHEWKREGFIEDYDQIDSMGYLVHPWLKYPKFGHARATDVACYWIRNGYITREEGVKLVKEHDPELDSKALNDFLNFTGYTDKEFWDIVEKFWNRDIFHKRDGKWEKKEEIK